MTTRRLIVTADDVGLDRGMTRGTLRAHREGIVTACSIVANGRDFDDACEQLRDVPALECGIHLTLVEEKPLLPAARIPSLTNGQGLFFRSYREVTLRLFAGRLRVDEIERELRAQIERVLAAGLRITHVNGHQHLHVLPRIFPVILRLVEEYRIPYIRIPAEGVAGLRPRSASIRVLNMFAGRARKRLAVAGMRSNDRTIGIVEAGRLDAAAIATLLDRVEGITELVCHPGISSEAMERRYRWGYRWDRETEALCDPELRATIAARGIELIAPSQA